MGKEVEDIKNKLEEEKINQNIILLKMRKFQNDLEKMKYLAPISGKITILNFKEGEYATAGKEVLIISDDRKIQIESFVKEYLFQKIKEGQKVSIVLNNQSKILNGHVAKILPRVIQEDGFYYIKLIIDFDENYIGNIILGYHVDLKILIGDRKSVV